MAKYRKKPVVIEAKQFSGDNIVEILKWVGSQAYVQDGLYIKTLEGDHKVSRGDYVVKGIKGEFYPCKPDIFELTYEKVEEDYAEQTYNIEPHEFIQSYIDDNLEYMDTGKISDGYHTFEELYYHRMILFAVICNLHKDRAWKSWKHHDGTMYDDYFIVGITTPKGQYSYHYHKDYWDIFNVIEVDSAPKWDGHKPEDVIRLLSLI